MNFTLTFRRLKALAKRKILFSFLLSSFLFHRLAGPKHNFAQLLQAFFLPMKACITMIVLWVNIFFSFLMVTKLTIERRTKWTSKKGENKCAYQRRSRATPVIWGRGVCPRRQRRQWRWQVDLIWPLRFQSRGQENSKTGFHILPVAVGHFKLSGQHFPILLPF